MKIMKPKRLMPGQTIGVVAPASPPLDRTVIDIFMIGMASTPDMMLIEQPISTVCLPMRKLMGLSAFAV